MLKGQSGKCNWCKQFFLAGDKLEIDHIIPKAQGAKDVYRNLQLLHQHCHDTKIARDVANLAAINSGAV
ncbi:HNH endonuclease signature motif containing protein [Chroococcidiopsis sp. SAG 2025]|uniref:HNH endonuclease n=1 Tax=Chroococcidiopsis sp. SAG 2025 TaxID=171389 RepID=UPI002936EBCB|nr:HNH endonuclease signature motif containing protein [Chroococcidiopsis sp. SAG 2025]